MLGAARTAASHCPRRGHIDNTATYAHWLNVPESGWTGKFAMMQTKAPGLWARKDTQIEIMSST